jgi:hypothetical protein
VKASGVGHANEQGSRGEGRRNLGRDGIWQPAEECAGLLTGIEPRRPTNLVVAEQCAF